MAFSEFEKARYGKLMADFVEKRRPPAKLRTKIDLAYRLTGWSIVLFEIRLVYLGKAGETMESPIAKATYIKSENGWKLYWKKQNLKWYAYEPHPFLKSLEKVIEVVDRDEFCCFFG